MVDKIKTFKVPNIPQTTNKCIRIPNDLIERIEKVIVGQDCTFSAFVNSAIRFVLENLEQDNT